MNGRSGKPQQSEPTAAITASLSLTISFLWVGYLFDMLSTPSNVIVIAARKNYPMMRPSIIRKLVFQLLKEKQTMITAGIALLFYTILVSLRTIMISRMRQ